MFCIWLRHCRAKGAAEQLTGVTDAAKAAQQAAEQNKASALSKLTALGLTENEIKALLG